MTGDVVLFQVIIAGLICYGLTIVVQYVMWLRRKPETEAMECPDCGEIELIKVGEFRYINAIHGTGAWQDEMECAECGHYSVWSQ